MLNSTASKTREMSAMYPVGQPSPQLISKHRMKTAQAQQLSLWCSLWSWLHSSFAGSIWLKSTNLTMSCDCCGTSPQRIYPSCKKYPPRRKKCKTAYIYMYIYVQYIHTCIYQNNYLFKEYKRTSN